MNTSSNLSQAERKDLIGWLTTRGFSPSQAAEEIDFYYQDTAGAYEDLEGFE